MLVGVIQKDTLSAMESLISQLDSNLYDLLELRLDALKNLDIESFCALKIPLPYIITLRSKEQGGAFEGCEKERIQLLCRLMESRPSYIDLEATLGGEIIQRIRAISPNTTVILSQHNFKDAPQSYDDMLAPMQCTASDVIYKFACMAHSTLDALRMLVYCKKQKNPVIGICMGEYGETTRILAPIVQSGFTYCPVEEASAPGQLDASLLKNTYNYSTLNRDTAIYGLLGDPVSRSIGHVFHNKHNAENNVNAVYVKWRLTPQELVEAMPLFHELDVKGLSVTMPLKEAMMEFLSDADESVRAIGAVNTLKKVPKGWAGTNTDGMGAISSLNMQLEGKKVIFLGAGGAAKAVMHAVARVTEDIVIYNRTVNKKVPLKASMQKLDTIHLLQEYDIIINGLPFDVPFDYNKVPFQAGTIAMDLSYGKKSIFLDQAAACGCICIDGSGMFAQQAILQRKYWGIPS